MRLLAITPAAAAGPIDLAAVDAWCRAGITSELAVLLREPGGKLADILSVRLRPLRERLAQRGIPALVSLAFDDDTRELDVAQLERARPALAGVQLRADPSREQIAHLRRLLPNAQIGASRHLAETRELGPRDEDYSCLAPIFAPLTQQDGRRKQSIGLAALRAFARSGPPVLALGGITPERGAACLDAGASGLAGISLFFGPLARTLDNARALHELLTRVPHVPQAR